MNLKKKLGMGIASAALGISLVGGGTVAYFSDTATQASTFASGTLNLDVDPTVLLNIGNLKPGDWTNKDFKLINSGTLDIKKVKLHTSYTVTKNNGNTIANSLANQYADAIIVDFLVNTGDIGQGNDIILSKSLLELRNMTPDDLAEEIVRVRQGNNGNGHGQGGWRNILVDGIKAGTGADSTDTFKVKFRFNETGAPQNELQDLKLNLTWQFEGIQEDGEQRN